jgi:hypothetical protein
MRPISFGINQSLTCSDHFTALQYQIKLLYFMFPINFVNIFCRGACELGGLEEAGNSLSWNFSYRAVGPAHKVLTYVEYRAVSGIIQNIDPLPLSTQQVCPPSAPKGGGGGDTHSPGGEGVGGQYFGRRQKLDWPLTE